MIRVGLRIKHAVFICCFMLVLMCAVNVQAVEEGIALPVSVKVYGEMSENSNVVANLIAGNTFQVMEKVSDDEGTVWCRIRTDFGASGYVKADEMNRLNADKQVVKQTTLENVENLESDSADENDLENTGSASDEDVSEENVFEEDIPDNNKDDQVVGEVIALANLNLRSMPSARSEIIHKVKQGVRLKCFQKIVNDAGESWYKVEYEGTEGYVIAKAVQFVETWHSDEGKAVSETEYTMAESDREEDAEMEVLSEEISQKEVSVQEEQQAEPYNTNTAQFTFEVDENPDIQKEHYQRKFDWMLIMLITGGILCITVIVIFLLKIRKLYRK